MTINYEKSMAGMLKFYQELVVLGYKDQESHVAAQALGGRIESSIKKDVLVRMLRNAMEAHRREVFRRWFEDDKHLHWDDIELEKADRMYSDGKLELSIDYIIHSHYKK